MLTFFKGDLTGEATRDLEAWDLTGEAAALDLGNLLPNLSVLLWRSWSALDLWVLYKCCGSALDLDSIFWTLNLKVLLS